MSIESRFIWMDGELVPYEKATIHVLSHTLHYGLGVFEGIRSYRQTAGGSGVWALDEHLRRMLTSAKMVRMDLGWSHDELRKACLDTLKANEMDAAYIRPLSFLGHGAMGLGARTNKVHTIVAVWNWGAYLGDEGLKNGIRVGTSSFVRPGPNAILQRAKIVGHYVNSIVARYEATDNGFDEAIMLDRNGMVAEGTGENVFVVRDNVVLTPPVANILEGITRKTCLDILKKEGIEVHVQQFGRDALYAADEIFLTGTAAEITPVREVDRRPVGPPGPVTKRVQEVYLSGVRGEVDWMRKHITPVV